ncbi:IS3 family transposase [Propionispora hippei]|uniref:Transposase InsO and inactivated derivatives n=1 Tax=Propionispora hippei DSM 15287 TaxID=1123003 RepID=A0A1M6K3L7_9FIRM|nr:IS3 family transposase [Propionispora hippei]SHJ53518.1 Transposase InsO and inactivated derivatives [Propionispora hippei DSM 15287]
MSPLIKYLAKDRYPVRVMCRFFGVLKSGYYDFVKRIDNLDRHAYLAVLVAKCQERCKKTYSCRQIWLKKKKNISINIKTVLRVMNKYGLLSEIRRRCKYRKMGDELHRYENVLNRDFYADRPNFKWVTDISYILTGEGTLYLSVIRDLYDNSIIAYKIGNEQTAHLLLNTIEAAMETEKITTELQLHSDQGLQYTSHAYFNLTREYGITPSMSRRGNCYDNAMAENFFGILKSECIYRNRPKTFSTARQIIDEYIHFYNHERIQLKSKLTSCEKRCQFA